MFDRVKFFDGIRGILKSNKYQLTQNRVDAIEFLITAFESNAEWKDIRHVAYAFATIAHETAWTFEPIVERGAKSYFNQYDIQHNKKKALTLGNDQPGDGYKYRGRGYVQLTGKANYQKAFTKLGYDLISNPELATQRAIAFNIMTAGMFGGWFTGKSLTDYISVGCDYVKSRRIINGNDKAQQIANYATQFEAVLRNSFVVQEPISLVAGAAAETQTVADDQVSGIQASVAGASTFIATTLGGILTFIQGYGWEIILGLAILGTVFVAARFWYASKEKDRMLSERMERERQQFELQLATLKRNE